MPVILIFSDLRCKSRYSCWLGYLGVFKNSFFVIHLTALAPTPDDISAQI